MTAHAPRVKAAPSPASAPPVHVRHLKPGEDERWDAYVMAHEGSAFFHLAGWAEVFNETYGYPSYRLIAERDGEICGLIPLLHVKTRLFGNSLISMGFYVEGGVLSDDDLARDLLLDEVTRLGEELGVDYVELRHRKPLAQGWLTKAETYAGFVREIAAEEDAALKQIPRKKRADVRKGINNAALSVMTGAPLADFYDCYATSLRNLGTPVHGMNFYRQIKQSFGDAVEISTVNGPQGPVCGLMSFYFKDRVMPYYGGAKPEARALHAYDYMYWALMRRAAERGVQMFDFGRSKTATGAYDYKKYWGFEPSPLHYQYHLIKAEALPDNSPNNPKYQRKIRLWQRLPLPVANRIGPWIARQIA